MAMGGSLYPEIPTAEEALGVDWSPLPFRGVAGPAELPEEVVTKVSDALAEITKDEEFIVMMESRGFSVAYQDAETFTQTVLRSRDALVEAMQAVGLAQEFAVAARAVGHGRGLDFAEHFLRQLIAEGRKDFEFGLRRLALRLHVRVLEVARGALIEIVEQVAVRPFEVEGVADGATYAGVCELGAARVEEPALSAGGILVGQR